MEAKFKHLDYIQAAIGRMATNSFLFKGWAITIAAALSAFGAVKSKEALLAVGLITTFMFWAMDAYYLWLERGFVNLHKLVATKNESDIDFSMQIDKSRYAWRWLKTCFRPHLILFYGVIIVTEVIGIFIVRSEGNGS